MKVSENAAAQELPLGDERKETKVSRHVVVALNQLNKQRDKLNVKIAALTTERDGIAQAIEALK